MQRLTCFVTCREFSGIVAFTSTSCPWKKRLTKQTPLSHQYTYKTRSYVERTAIQHWDFTHLRRYTSQFTGQTYRHYSTGSNNDSTNTTSHPGVTVVGSPDPLTWIRNKIVLSLIELYFDLNMTGVEFDTGVKQALVHVSNSLSKGKFEDLRRVMSKEALEHTRKKYKLLTEGQRKDLAISLDNIIFLLPEDVSVVFDRRGRKFCYIVIRFWHLSAADVPEDPEGVRIFKVSETNEDGPPKKIVTAVYEFHSELTVGADPDWTITHIWHWKQLE
ncbi:m-AAA protease-interacting protein 1, mitochondrial [Chanos chanos]|uniref:M-AAA protease-interacting protein 1, mitochondrial n=1 Tax=Chanos chanos TaxID=29144 RepID=A0A6J2W9J3_CHACN|nr:m-AAA protease-interacting protein 1, mitochondrial-like [Chanos chanos]